MRGRFAQFGLLILFLGLAAAAAPMHVNAQVAVVSVPSIYAADVRVPTHPVQQDPPGGL